jgi:hypothetical protein
MIAEAGFKMEPRKPRIESATTTMMINSMAAEAGDAATALSGSLHHSAVRLVPQSNCDSKGPTSETTTTPRQQAPKKQGPTSETTTTPRNHAAKKKKKKRKPRLDAQEKAWIAMMTAEMGPVLMANFANAIPEKTNPTTTATHAPTTDTNYILHELRNCTKDPVVKPSTAPSQQQPVTRQLHPNHAWLEPPHRKTLRQQPHSVKTEPPSSAVRLVPQSPRDSKGTTLDTTTTTHDTMKTTTTTMTKDQRRVQSALVTSLQAVFRLLVPDEDTNETPTALQVIKVYKEFTAFYEKYAHKELDDDSHWLFDTSIQDRFTSWSYRDLKCWLLTWLPCVEKRFPNPETLPLRATDIPAPTPKAKPTVPTVGPSDIFNLTLTEQDQLLADIYQLYGNRQIDPQDSLLERASGIFQYTTLDEVCGSEHDMWLMLDFFLGDLIRVYPNPSDIPRIPNRKERRSKKVFVHKPWTPREAWAREVTDLYTEYADKVDEDTRSMYFNLPLEEVLKDYKACHKLFGRRRSPTESSPREMLASQVKLTALQPPGNPTESLEIPQLESTFPDSQEGLIQPTLSHEAPPAIPFSQDQKPKRVTFLWREWVYDEAGNCHLRYSKGTDRSTTDKVHLTETRHGSRLEEEQQESHEKFKSARVAHQAMLQRVRDEISRQRVHKDIGRRQVESISHQHPTSKQHPLEEKSTKSTQKSTQPSHINQKSPSTKPFIIPTATHSMEVLEFPRILSLPKFSKIKAKNAFIKNTQAQPEAPKIPKTTTSQTKTLLTIFWIQHARGVSALHTSHPSYLLPLPWQHQAWIAPAHRKALRQQPFSM